MRRLIIGGVLAASLLVVPATPAAAKTTVKVKGDDVTITVHVDCVGCTEWPAPGGGDLAKYWKKQAEMAWNAAFDKFSYCNKYKFKLEIDIEAGGYDLQVRDGAHQIQVQEPGSGYGGAGWDGVLERTPGGIPGQSSPDGTRYYTDNGGGIMPADATPTVISHEFGHVIGLGDDRDASGNVLSGRDRTLMAGGSTNSDGKPNTENSRLKIDKQLIDRIGNQLANLGKIKCGAVWKGPIRSTYNNVTPCTGSDEGTITVRVVGDKDVSGTVAVSGSFTCPTELVTVTGAGTVTFGVTGTFTGDEFRLLWEPPVVTTGDGPSAYCGAIRKRPIVVPVTERGTAQASFEEAITGGQFTCEITLERQPDDEPVG
ncbi:MAG: immune inhibitor A domain-containing protein [Actinomycetota bacterium]